MIEASRDRDVRALLATLFLSRGTPMITAGDEFGRTQQGNNNAYCQDNSLTWLDWEHADLDLAAFVGRLAWLRRGLPQWCDSYLSDDSVGSALAPSAQWFRADGKPKRGCDWNNSDCFVLLCSIGHGSA